MRSEFATVLDELLSDDPMPPGRQHKKLQGPGDFLLGPRQFRLVYVRLEGGLFLPYAVGSHDDAYRI